MIYTSYVSCEALSYACTHMCVQGWPHKRVRGADYDRFVDKFVGLVRKYYPHSLLHFEDFGVDNAKRLLDLYRDKHAVFNDDV